jgi:diadenosine tetraphosphatase ApaH/serine/threonine PP2A family protein phosphatase
VGHSHVALAFGLDDDDLHGGLAPDGTEIELTGRLLLNPGSVGQPRDGDPRAAWLELDTDARFARFHRVAYPIEQTQAAVREHGLPEGLAARLATGT